MAHKPGALTNSCREKKFVRNLQLQVACLHLDVNFIAISFATLMPFIDPRIWWSSTIKMRQWSMISSRARMDVSAFLQTTTPAHSQMSILSMHKPSKPFSDTTLLRRSWKTGSTTQTCQQWNCSNVGTAQLSSTRLTSLGAQPFQRRVIFLQRWHQHWCGGPNYLYTYMYIYKWPCYTYSIVTEHENYCIKMWCLFSMCSFTLHWAPSQL